MEETTGVLLLETPKRAVHGVVADDVHMALVKLPAGVRLVGVHVLHRVVVELEVLPHGGLVLLVPQLPAQLGEHVRDLAVLLAEVVAVTPTGLVAYVRPLLPFHSDVCSELELLACQQPFWTV